MKTTMCRRLAPWNGIMCKKLRTLDSDLSHTITFVTLRIAIAQAALERADRAAFDVGRFEEKRMGYISRPSWRRATQLAGCAPYPVGYTSRHPENDRLVGLHDSQEALTLERPFL
jgi:hypothetical protein